MNRKSASLDNTGERMIPEYHKGNLIYAEHITRYVAAQALVAGKVVLDIASGSGYGARMLAKKATKVYGVDNSEETVKYAQENFAGSNIEYKVGNATAIPLEDNSVDVVVTFETIEHVKKYEKFLREVKRVLKPDGLAIISTPNDAEFAEGNHFHVHEFTYEELLQVIGKEFTEIKPYFQATWQYVALGSEELMRGEGSISIDSFNLAPLARGEYLYFYLLCSNREVKETIKPIGALGEHYSHKEVLKAHLASQEAIAYLKKTLSNQEQRNHNLEQVEGEYKNEIVKLHSELQAITSSRSYRVARKLAQVRRRLFRYSSQG